MRHGGERSRKDGQRRPNWFGMESCSRRNETRRIGYWILNDSKQGADQWWTHPNRNKTMKPICVPCQRFFKPFKNGRYFLEGMPIENGAKPGVSEAAKWAPYRLWVGDVWKCQGCGAEIISGVGRGPISEHYMPEFNRQREELRADFQVNDC